MILITTVRHSQSVTATPLHPAKRSGMILFSHCTCMAGLGMLTHHVHLTSFAPISDIDFSSPSTKITLEQERSN